MMIMRKGYKYQLQTKPKTSQKCAQFAGLCRFVWNQVLALNEGRYLQVSTMSRSAKGTVDEPGRNVAAKSGLNQAILDQGWGLFRRMLAYKQLWRGGRVIAVAPQYTSKTCAECGYISFENRVVQALFSCVVCGHPDHVDVNAARVILAVGLTESLVPVPQQGLACGPLRSSGIPVL